MLAFKKDCKIINDSDQFSNVICFIVFLITGKWVFTSVHFVSSECDSEHGNMTHFIRKSTNLALFLKNLVVSESSLQEFEMYYGCVFILRIYCIIKKMERWPRDNKKVIFCFVFGLKICPVQTYGTIL